MWFSNYRQKLQLLIILFFTFIAFGAADDAWMPWVRALASSIARARSLHFVYVLCGSAHYNPLLLICITRRRSSCSCP